MDEQTIFNLLECSVCLEPLDVTSRVLPCQHTFCMRCLQQIINTRNELKCPECRELVPCRTVTDLPTNILLVRLLDGLKRSGGKAPGSPPPRTSNASVGVSAVGGEAVLSAGRGITGKNSIQNQPCAMALYKYEAQEHGDLSFNKSDIILLHKRIDDNWYQGVVMGATDQTMGFFPSSYVQVLTPLPPDPPQCKALYDFEVNEREEKDCLTFNKDEVLNVIRRVDENWVEGQKGDKIGIFPLSFVELNGTAKALVDAHAGVDASSGPFHQSQGSGDAGSSPDQAGSSQEGGSKNKVKRHSFTSLLGLSTSAQNKNKDSQPSTTTNTSTSNAASTSTSSSASGSSSNRHSMEISSPVLVRSSNPTAANLIDSKAVASGASQQAAASGSAAAAASVVSAGAAGVAGNAAETSATGRKKPAPLTGISQMPASGPRGPNSPSMAASPTVTQAGNAEFRFVGEAPSSPKPKVEVYVAMYSYKQTKADEIELKKGDFYTVTEKCKDGWFKGMAVKTGDLGVFPGNYMQAYRTSRKTATTAPESRPLQSTPAATSSTGQNIRPRLPSDAATRGTSSRVVSNEAPRSPSPAQGMRPRVMSDASTRFAPQRAAAVRTVEAGASTKEISAASNPVSLSSATTQTTISRTGSNPSRATQPNQTAVSVQSDRKTASQIPDGQKTVAQLQSERAAQLLQYRPPPPNYPVRPGHSSVGQARVNATPHPDRTLRGSPPTVGTQTVTTSTRTSTGQVQGGASGAQSVASQPQGVQNRQPVPMSVRLRASSGQAVVGSPPMHNGIAQRVRSPSSPQPNAQDSSIAGDGGGVSGKPRGSPVMGQGLPRGSSAITSTALPQSTPPQVEVHVSNKNKRHSAQIPATVTELQARQPVVKPRRHSESDNDPVRSRRTVQPKTASHQHPPQCNAQLQTLISSSNSNSQQPGTASPNTKQTIAVSSTGNAVQQSHSKPSSPSVYRVSDILPLAAPTPNATAAPDCVVPSLASSGKADKKEKKDRKVAKKRPQGSPEDGAPVPLARGSSLPNGQDAVTADSSRPHSPGPTLTASAAVSAPQGEASADDASVVLGAEGTSESAVDRRDKPPKTTPLVRERYRVTAPYPPNTDAELELKVGDTVFVHSKRDDGWFKGTQQRTGKMGLFPGSFVESY